MASIVISGDTSGSVTLQAPAVAGSTVLNLPSTSGTIQASGAGYTTNGVAYATSATGLATGSALTFNGTDLLLASGGLFDIDSTNAAVAMRIRQTTVGAGTEFTTTITENTGVTFDSSDSAGATARSFVWTAAGSEGMRLTSTGLGIKTSTPIAPLTVQGDSGGLGVSLIGRSAGQNEAWLFWYKNGGSTLNAGILGDNQGLKFAVGSGPTEAARFDTSGNLGLGVTPSAWGGSIKALEGFSTSGSWSIASGGGLGSALNIQSNAYYDGSNWIYKSTSPAANYYQSAGTHVWRIAASGTAGNAISFTESARIDSSGNFLVGSTSNILSAKFLSRYNGSTQNGAVLDDLNNTSASGFMAFSVSNGSYCGNITRIGSTAAVGYNSGSDERLKENIVDAPASNINDIKVRSFNWKSDSSFQPYGLIAQELLESAPYSVYQPEDPNAMMGVDNSKLVPMMIKAIQEQQALITTLTDRITALEGV